MKTVKQLIAMCDRQKIWEAYALLNENMPPEPTAGFNAFLDSLLGTEPVPCKDEIVLCANLYSAYHGPYPDTYMLRIGPLKKFFRTVDLFDAVAERGIETLSAEELYSLRDSYREYIYGLPRGVALSEENDGNSLISYAYELEERPVVLGYLVPDHASGPEERYRYAAMILDELSFFG